MLGKTRKIQDMKTRPRTRTTEDTSADISQMTPMQLTFHLRYDKMMSCEEIAEFLGVPVGTVVSRLARERRKRGIRADSKRRSLRLARESG